MSIKTVAVVTICLAACTLSACGSPSPKETPKSPDSPSLSPPPAPTAPVTPTADPEKALLTIEQINEIVAQADPGAPAFHTAEPIRHEPNTPWEGLAAPCVQVFPLYFGSGEARFTRYVMASVVGEGNVFVNQLVAQFSSPAQAATRFAQLTRDLPECADAADADPAMGFTLKIGETTSSSARFEKTAAGANQQMPNSHAVNNEYRLVGDAIIGAWATESGEVVTTIADQLGKRLGG